MDVRQVVQSFWQLNLPFLVLGKFGKMGLVWLLGPMDIFDLYGQHFHTLTDRVTFQEADVLSFEVPHVDILGTI